MTMSMFSSGQSTPFTKIRDLHREIQADIAEKKAKKAHKSQSKWPYEPRFTDNLNVVNVAGSACLRNAGKLQLVMANGLGLYRSIVSVAVNAGSGDVKIVDSKIKQSLYVNGKVIIVKSSDIDWLHILPREGKQVIKITDTIISKLSLPSRKMTLERNLIGKDLSYRDEEQNFTLLLKNVTIQRVGFF